MNPRDDKVFAAQYNAMDDGCGHFELSNWSVVTLAGADRHDFFHNMCTNDIRKLGTGTGCEAFCTDVKGKIVAHVFALLLSDRIVLLTVPGQARRIIEHLDRYVIREDVRLANASQEQAWTVLVGPRAEAVLPSTLSETWQNMNCRVEAVECLLVRFPLPGRSAYLLGCPAEQVATLHGELNALGAVACGEEVWTSLRVEAGLPLFGVDFEDTNLPQEVSRDAQAISFTKGCYLGQETIARIDALGHVNKQLATLQFAAEAAPTPGVSLTHEGKSAGTATSVGWSRRLGAPLALGMVRRASNAVGTQLESPCGPVEVINTPAME
jgi:folate-binding protein YgfZ